MTEQKINTLGLGYRVPPESEQQRHASLLNTERRWSIVGDYKHYESNHRMHRNRWMKQMSGSVVTLDAGTAQKKEDVTSVIMVQIKFIN